ncbi:MAG TPA: glycoside hydrolase family 3 N-terminal domain-containing protein [Polyangiaceae bacterium]|nr:glycoside hydrolase family 3 N-terminal domain-containing protein [Polyangiaceae bacterium]
MKYRLSPSPRAEELAGQLSVRDAINQVCCPLFNFDASATLGGGHMARATAEQIRVRIEALRSVCNVPPLCTADLECGAGRAVLGLTVFPDLMALGANDSEDLAYEVGKATALEGRSVGLNWTFSPCVDVAELPDSPAVSTRSAGRSVERVIKTARGYLRGLQDHGMVATLKHFPGDGYTTYDQHLTTVNIPFGMEEWWRGPGRIYRELIDAGARTIMAGHIALPAYDEKDAVLGLYPPATLSPRLLGDLLRGELGFEGLLVSDAMNMAGVAGFMHPFESYARFLEAGGDMVLFPRVSDASFYSEMERLLAGGQLTEHTLYDRAARVLAFKEDLGLLSGPGARHELASEFDAAAHAALARRVTEGAIALVRDRAGTLPVRLEPSTRVLHVVLSPSYEEDKAIYAALTSALGRRANVEQLIDPGPHVLFERAREFDLIVCSIGAITNWGVNVARLHGPICRNLMGGWMRLGTPVVFVDHIHPFSHLEYAPVMDCVLNTFRSLEATGERLVRGLVGEQPFTGKF